jgi:hypothetical protein
MCTYACEYILTGKESGNILKRDDGDVESVAETDEASALDRCVNVQAAGHLERLVAQARKRRGETKMSLHVCVFDEQATGCALCKVT